MVDEMAQRCIEVLPGDIDQLGAVVRTDLRHLLQLLLHIRSATALNLGVGEDLDDLLQGGDLAVVKAARGECRQDRTRG